MAPLLAKSPERQFERMYRRHASDVYRYSLAVLRNPHDAEDVTQTTFLNAFRAMQNGDRPETPKNWLITIAHNVCRQRFRQQQRRPQQSQLLEETLVDEPDESITADDIQRALGHLAFTQRAALVMRELEGRSYPEIANIMGLSVSAVETLLFRARRALREQLEESLTCAEAERFMSRKLDGQLTRDESGRLRAHLRECKSCEQLARRERASRGALKSFLGALPLPNFLPQAGYSIGAKLATLVCAGAVVGGGGYAVGTNRIPLESPVRAAEAAVSHVPFVPHSSPAPAQRVASPGSTPSAAARSDANTAAPAQRNPVAAHTISSAGKKLVPPGRIVRLQHPQHPINPGVLHAATTPAGTDGTTSAGSTSSGGGNGNGNAGGNGQGSGNAGSTDNPATGHGGTPAAASVAKGANGKHLGQQKQQTQTVATAPTPPAPDPTATDPTGTEPAATTPAGTTPADTTPAQGNGNGNGNAGGGNGNAHGNPHK